MLNVILAEKPNQAAAYAASFAKSERKNGYYDVQDSVYDGQIVITYGFGHLVELASPEIYSDKYEKWDIRNLPIFPDPFKFVVSKDKKAQFKIVSDWLKKADKIIIATDSDREGENIAWSIMKLSGADIEHKSIKRLWVNSLEKAALQDGFRNLEDGYTHYNSFVEAQTREYSDWLVGMNGSPLYSLSLWQRNVRGVFSIGRVQTPTLYMIYERQRAIEGFVSKPFSELVANVHTNEGGFKAKMDPTTKFNDDTELAEFMREHNLSYDSQQAKVIDVNNTEKKTESPRLFSLSALQSKANKMFKASANDTLNAVQSLYEKKFLTYPRTDTQFITENEFKYLNEQYPDYLSALGLDAVKFYSEPRKRYVDGKKVQEHHAIIPTRTIPSEDQKSNLSALESQIYWLVLKNTIAMFLADFTYDETTITVGINDVNFKAVGKVITGNGWKEIFCDETNNNNEAAILPNVTTGQVINATLNAEHKMTTPPESYTEGTLITAMKRAGRELSDDEKEILSQTEGIGTEATRAGIIDRLKDKKYIVVEKNKLKVTTQGIILCEAVKMQPLLTSPELTAKWELTLSDIGHGKRTQDEFLTNIHKLVNKLVQEVPGQIAEGTTLNNSIQIQASEQAAEKEKLLIGKCPVCKTGNITDRKTFYGCSNYKADTPCKFSIAKKISGKTITKAIAKQLIDDGQTKELKGFKSKAGKEFSASLKLVNSKIEFNFSK